LLTAGAGVEPALDATQAPVLTTVDHPALKLDPSFCSLSIVSMSASAQRASTAITVASCSSTSGGTSQSSSNKALFYYFSKGVAAVVLHRVTICTQCLEFGNRFTFSVMYR
jgi:hypothetical protein